MKIIYVANFEAGGTDDEGAILHAFRELGHTVEPVREQIGYRAANIAAGADLLLFHKWCDPGTLKAFGSICKRAFWWFDLVDHPDLSIRRRCDDRRAWMQSVIPYVDFGFLSDGDWVANCPWERHKLHYLPQGADGRIAGRGTPKCWGCGRDGWQFDILFTGIDRGGGDPRESWVREMSERYGDRFKHVRRGVYREELRDLIAAAKVVVAPDFPVTDRYCSNRIWNAAGFGAFLVHPYSQAVARAMGNTVEWYMGRDQMHRLIDWALGLEDGARRQGSQAALDLVLERHLYRHRCEELIKVIKE